MQDRFIIIEADAVVGRAAAHHLAACFAHGFTNGGANDRSVQIAVVLPRIENVKPLYVVMDAEDNPLHATRDEAEAEHIARKHGPDAKILEAPLLLEPEAGTVIA